jgi:hypothetical protein
VPVAGVDSSLPSEVPEAGGVVTAIANIGQRDMLRRFIDIYLGEEHGDGRITAYLPDGVQKVLTEADGVQLEPTLSLREESARALLQALLRYYQGGDDLRALRKDYDAERARVDKLIELVAR